MVVDFDFLFGLQLQHQMTTPYVEHVFLIFPLPKWVQLNGSLKGWGPLSRQEASIIYLVGSQFRGFHNAGSSLSDFKVYASKR